MKLTKFLTTILVAVLLATAASGCSEDEWSNENKLFDSLLKPTPNYQTYGVDPDHRCIFLYVDLSKEEVENDAFFKDRKHLTVFESESQKCSVGFVENVDNLRPHLSLSNDRKVLFNNFEVDYIEDVMPHNGVHGLHYHSVGHNLSVALLSPGDLPAFTAFIKSIGCNIVSTYFDKVHYDTVYRISLPVERKALSTCEHIESNFRVKYCYADNFYFCTDI